MSLRLYVSGPMTGHEDYNFPAFEAAAKRLRAFGHHVVTPHELDAPEELAELKAETEAGDPYGPAYERFLARDVDLLETADLDGIVCLQGWQHSRGVARELETAAAKSLKAWKFNYATGLGEPLNLEPYAATQIDVTRIDITHGNPKDREAAKLNKAPLDLLEPVAEEQIARALKFGADKYGVRNFVVDPIRARVYVAAMRRHIDAWLDGEDNAPDSGVHHLAHIGANVHVALKAIDVGSFIDDRAA